MREYAEAVPVAELADHFAAPPRRFGPIAFWFLNDHCDPNDLLRQLDAFAAAGFGGVCPCARVGLDPDVGYLTDRWFQILDLLMQRCQELGLQVILYDEASYPSGSANGAVAAANPDHLARALVLGDSIILTDGRPDVPTPIDGPGSGTSDPTNDSARPATYWRPSTGRSLVDRLVAVVAGQLDGNGLVRVDTVRTLQPGEHGLIRLETSQLPGRWQVMALYDVPSGGRIRGAYAHTDDGSPLAPAASNLLDPDAVASFITITHDAYARRLGRWFGDPIVGWFTDEPHVLGRGHRTDARPWTPQLLDDLRAAAPGDLDPVLLLPALFVDYDDDRGFADRFTAAVSQRLSRIYYGAQRQWCDDHGLALTGHPCAPDELSPLDNFTWPGQDVVWRWVLPGPTALHGPESGSARSAASAAEERGVRTALSEVLGAYGWGLTLDEAKWLLDWHLVRGTTTFLLHAFFESVRGNRAFESQPDLGLHNAWWPHLPALTAYLARASMVLGSLHPQADVAVVVSDDRVPTDEVADLVRHQVTFRYVTVDQVMADPRRFRAIAVAPADASGSQWEQVRATGLPCHLLDGSPWWQHLRPTEVTVLAGPAPDLRLARWSSPPPGPGGTVRPGMAEGRNGHWLLLTNEGEQTLTVGLPTGSQVWDCWTGQCWSVSGPTELPRRQSWVLALPSVDGSPGTDGPAAPLEEPVPLDPAITVTDWRADGLNGQAWPGPALGDWTRVPELETWSGSVRHHATIDLSVAPTGPVRLDLGRVGELARVEVNGEFVAEVLWAPYTTVIPAGLLREGRNTLLIVVTNSSANHYEGALRPSGLIGPVTLGAG